MAVASLRPTLTDYLQVYPFWLMDVAPIDTFGLPIFTPLFGFSSVSAPEINMEMQAITEGNWYFEQKVFKHASVSNMTLTRGVTFYDSDFWRWVVATLTGDTQAFKSTLLSLGGLLKIGGPSPRRNLLLVHYFSRSPFSGVTGAVLSGTLTALLASAGGGLSLGTVASQAIGQLGLGPFEFAARIPARAILLQGCLPTRYKMAGDFDARSSEISLMELDISVEEVEEISLTSL